MIEMKGSYSKNISSKKENTNLAWKQQIIKTSMKVSTPKEAYLSYFELILYLLNSKSFLNLIFELFSQKKKREDEYRLRNP